MPRGMPVLLACLVVTMIGFGVALCHTRTAGDDPGGIFLSARRGVPDMKRPTTAGGPVGSFPMDRAMGVEIRLPPFRRQPGRPPEEIT